MRSSQKVRNMCWIGDCCMRLWLLALGGGCMLLNSGLSRAEPLNLFSNIVYSADGNSPPPEDSLAVYDSSLDISGLAGMPDLIAVNIPRPGDALSATIRLESMIRREGFTERDPAGCNSENPPPGACEIVPYPELPADQFSYTWTGRGDDYDLRLTVHRGHATGVFSGPRGRDSLECFEGTTAGLFSA